MFNENTPARIIQDIRYAGISPWVQYDILDARTLLQMFQQTTQAHYLNSRRLGRILVTLEMRLVGLYFICGRQCRLWTCLPPQPPERIAELFRERVRTDAKELHMELQPGLLIPDRPLEPIPFFTTFTRDVLSARLRPYGTRYPRPKEIARLLDCGIVQVNVALQHIRRKLRLSSLKDTAALREAVRKSGALMDDPAFQ